MASSSRESFVYLAKIAEQAERYDGQSSSALLFLSLPIPDANFPSMCSGFSLISAEKLSNRVPVSDRTCTAATLPVFSVMILLRSCPSASS